MNPQQASSAREGRSAIVDHVLPQPLRVAATGDGRAAGVAHGRAAGDLVRHHLEIALDRLGEHGLARGAAGDKAIRYREAVAKDHPELAAEVDGIAEGARIAIGMAWVLQLRAELTHPNGGCLECTSLAGRDGSGRVIVAQNIDLPEVYRDLLILLERSEPQRPTVLTLTPAGQVGQCGINSEGVVLMANFIHTPGWRCGVPRYLLTRIGLRERTRGDAVAALQRARRAASRNILVAGPDGASNLELTPESAAITEMNGAPLLHTNHILSELSGLERAPQSWLENSRARLQRLAQLTAGGPLDRRVVVKALSDRRGVPSAICHHAGDDEDAWVTVASVIAEPDERRLWVVVGPPSGADYQSYRVG